MKINRILLGAILGLAAFGSAMAEDAAGLAKSVATVSEAAGPGGTRTLVAGGDVFIGDVIRTSASGRVEIVFTDNTQLVVGPGSSLRLEDYLLRADGSAGNLAVKMLAGTFRFVSGDSDHDHYRLATPTGTIGIRGTAFDVVVDPSGSRVIMYSGATELCAAKTGCVTIANTCEMGAITPAGVVSLGTTDTFSRNEQKALRKQFVFGASQQALSSAFRLRQTAACLLSPLPFSPGFFSQQNKRADAERPVAAAGTDMVSTDGSGPQPAGGVEQPDNPAPTPTGPSPTPSDESGGDCAGNSSHNPGRSQNCSK